jgi:hypothetical protein
MRWLVKSLRASPRRLKTTIVAYSGTSNPSKTAVSEINNN